MGSGGGGVLPYISYIGASPSGRVFASFWSENEYTVYPFWSGIGYGFFEGTTEVYERSFRFNFK